MGTKVKFQLTPDILTFDPTKPCDNQVKYKVFIFLKQDKNKEFFINRYFNRHPMSFIKFCFLTTVSISIVFV